MCRGVISKYYGSFWRNPAPSKHGGGPMAQAQDKKRDLKKVGRRDDAAATPNPDVLEKGKKIKENIDKLLAEIHEEL